MHEFGWAFYAYSSVVYSILEAIVQLDLES